MVNAIGMSSFMAPISEGMSVRPSQHQVCGCRRGLFGPPEGCWQRQHATKSKYQMWGNSCSDGTQRLPPTMPNKRRGSQARRATVEDVRTSAATPATSEACLQSEHRVRPNVCMMWPRCLRLGRLQLPCGYVCWCTGVAVSNSLMSKFSLSRVGNCRHGV